MKLKFLAALVSIGLVIHAGLSAADDYPSKPIRVIVPYAAGGADLYIRPIQGRIEKALGQPMLIENVGGAGGIIGATQVKNAPPDGYTILFGGSGAVVSAPKLATATYTWRDFTPVANVIAIPWALVTRPDSGIKTFADFLARARANPGKLSYGSPGHGTSTQMAADSMAAAACIKITEVPYQGGAPAATALLGGHVDTMIGAPSIVMPHVRAGKLVALAVTSGKRFAPSKEIPTWKENGIDVVVVANFGFYVRKGTPDAIVTKLAAVVADVVRDPAYVESMEKGFNAVDFLGPKEYAEAVEEEDRTFTKIIKDMGLGAK